MYKIKIRRGDQVKVITGKDKGKLGEVLKVIPEDNKIIIKGINLAKKHTKPTQTSEGGIIHKELPIHVSNVSHIDPKSQAVTKLGYKTLETGEKVRFAKKSGEIIPKKEGK